jgi:nucleoside-diphosphate-sugar epimerase
MSERKWSLIRVYRDTKKALDELKVHPRETYDQVIRRLIEAYKPKR